MTPVRPDLILTVCFLIAAAIVGLLWFTAPWRVGYEPETPPPGDWYARWSADANRVLSRQYPERGI